MLGCHVVQAPRLIAFVHARRGILRAWNGGPPVGLGVQQKNVREVGMPQWKRFPVGIALWSVLFQGCHPDPSNILRQRQAAVILIEGPGACHLRAVFSGNSVLAFF